MIDIIGDPAYEILRHLDFRSLVAACEVSQSWNAVIMDLRKLWLDHLKYFCSQLKERYQRHGLDETNAPHHFAQLRIVDNIMETGTTEDLKCLTMTISSNTKSDYHVLLCPPPLLNMLS